MNGPQQRPATTGIVTRFVNESLCNLLDGSDDIDAWVAAVLHPDLAHHVVDDGLDLEHAAELRAKVHDIILAGNPTQGEAALFCAEIARLMARFIREHEIGRAGDGS